VHVKRRVLFFREDELSLTANAKIRAGTRRPLAAGRLALDPGDTVGESVTGT
jgi:hypothetical protein